jgi:ComF family protein
VGRFFPAFEQRCVVCGVVLSWDDQSELKPIPAGVCASCRPLLKPRTSAFCPRCGLIFPSPEELVYLCLDCRLAPPPWQEIFFFGVYEGLLKDLVLRYKFHGQLGLSLFLQGLLQHALSRSNGRVFDIVVPVPLHPKKLRRRGFNQSLELVKGLDRKGQGTVEPAAIIRIRNTPDQHALTRVERMRNLEGAFLADSTRVGGQSVLLVDDILTTGATAEAATKALLKAGARDVSLAVLARA